MRNMSFSITTEQARAMTKTVTRRLGWWFLKPGDRIQQVVKGMGLKKGEHPEKIHVIEVVSTRSEMLKWLIDDPQYGAEELEKEGFRCMCPRQFVRMFCEHNGCTAAKTVNRIEFRYVSGYAEDRPHVSPSDQC